MNESPIPREVFAALMNRLDGVCKLILENPKLNDMSRTKATGQAAIYSVAPNGLARESGGLLPQSAKPLMGIVNEFIVVVESFCSDDNKPFVKN